MLKCHNVLWGSLPLVLLPICTHQKKETQIDTTDAVYTTDVPNGRSSVIFYRRTSAIEGSTIDIYVNSQHLGSLQSNACRQELICTQNQKLHAGFTKQDAAYQHKVHSGDYYSPPEGMVSFFRVINDDSGHPVLQSVPPEQAKAEMKDVKRQNHTLSRIVSKDKCAQVLKKYSLQASALFKFDRLGYRNMLEQNKHEVSATSQDIKQNPATVTNVNVVGHTDPEGKPEYNDALSVRHA